MQMRPLPTAAALVALPLVAHAQLPPPQLYEEHQITGGATVESLFTEDDLQNFLLSSYVFVDSLDTYVDGDLLIACATDIGDHFVHWEADTGAFTEILTDFDIQAAIGGSGSGFLALGSVELTTAGEIWFQVSEYTGAFGGLVTQTHLVSVPLSGSWPSGYGAPTSVFNYPSDVFAPGLLRATPIGSIDLIIDSDTCVEDAIAGIPGNGFYRWFPGASVLPVPSASFLAAAAVCSRGGPNITGTSTAEDTGYTNMASGINRVFATHADTAGYSAPNDDGVDQEVYDGDIITIDTNLGVASLLISKQRYIEVSNGLAGVQHTDSRSIINISLMNDWSRDRLYTFEYTYAWTDYYADTNQVVRLMQWNATTGAFEDTIATVDDLITPWTSQGIDPTYVGQFGIPYEVKVTSFEGDMKLGLDGSIYAALSPGKFELPFHVVRITPDNL